jgi:hypothetical protein
MRLWKRKVCYCILLLTSTFVDSFSFNSPLKVFKKVDNKHKHEFDPSAPLQMSGDDGETENSPVARFLTVLFRGMTLPFPTLRNLSQGSTRDDDASVVGLSLRESLLAILVYLGLGAIAYHSTVQEWSFVDALYFSVVTFTTVGYGDLCPTTGAGKVFTVLFGLSGISILGVAIGTIGSRLVQKENDMIHAARQASRKRILGFWNTIVDDDSSSSTRKVDEQIEETTTTGTTNLDDTTKKEEKESSWWRQSLDTLVRKSVPALAVLLLGGAWMGKLEGWSLGDAIYYSFITAGTLGYGDFSPVTRPGRIWGVVFIPLAVAAAGEVLGNVASALSERRQQKFYHSIMSRELNAEQLVEMDTDRNAKVSREEYVEFMLKDMQLVDEDVFQELHAQFQKLDVDGGGYLDKNDLRRKLIRTKQNDDQQST